MHLGRLFARKGEFEQASELLNAARDHFVQVGDRVELLATEARLAESLLLAAMPDEALALADATFEKAAVTEGSSLLMPLIGRVRGCALMQLDRVDQARAALEESLSAARELRMDYEIGLTLSALVDLAERTGTPDVEARQERGAIFGRLGVVAASEDS